MVGRLRALRGGSSLPNLTRLKRWKSGSANREHVKVQDEAREKWWTAYYLRKGRLLADNEAATGTILHETMLLRETALSDTEHTQVTTAPLGYFALRSHPL